jgi:hypothetical protein
MSESPSPFAAVQQYRKVLNEDIKRADAYKQDTRTVETGLLKLALTVAGGTLGISIGFILGERRVEIPSDLVPWVRAAWTCLLISMVAAIASWSTTSWLMTATSRKVSQAHRRFEQPKLEPNNLD